MHWHLARHRALQGGPRGIKMSGCNPKPSRTALTLVNHRTLLHTMRNTIAPFPVRLGLSALAHALLLCDLFGSLLR
jgi:hypothetical protein